MRRRVLGLILSAFFVVMAFAMSMSWNFSKIDQLLQTEVRNIPKRDIPLKATIGKSYIRFIPLELTVTDVHIEPQGSISEQIEPLDVSSVTVRPSLWHLAVGKIHLASLIANKAHVQLNIKEQKNSETPDIDIFKILSMIPISKLELDNFSVSLKTKVESQVIRADFKGIDSTIINEKDFLNLSLRIHELSTSIDQAVIMQKGFFETKFIITKTNLVLSDFKLKEQNSFVVAAGTSQINLKKKTFGKGNINVRAETSSEKVRFIYKLITKKEKTPLDDLHTLFRGDVRLNLDSKIENTKAQIEAALFNFQYEKFRVGNLLAKATYNGSEKKINIQEARLTNNGITAHTKSTVFYLDTLSFDPVDVNVKMFRLKDYLLYSINNKLTSDLNATGNVQCSGVIENLKITCKGAMTADTIYVNSGSNQPIVSIPKASATGSVVINSKEVSYIADVTSQSTQGVSSGTINFENGFNIQFSSPKLNATEIKNLSKLEIAGTAKVSGSTIGNSKTATFELAMDAENFELNRFKLGTVSSQLRYKSGVLYFSKIQGALVSSRYLGDLDIDLNSDRMNGKLQFPFIDLAVIQDSIKSHLNIPFTLSGSGSAIVSLASPLDINRLSLQAKARLYNCKVDAQHIDNIDLDVVSDDGKMQLRSAILEEKTTSVRVDGGISIRDEEFDLRFSSKRAHTEDVVYTSSLLKKIKGTVKVDGSITKSFKSPAISMNFSSEEFFYAKQSLAPLNGKIFFSKENTSVAVKAGDKFQVQFVNHTNSPTYQIEGFTNDFDISPIIATTLDSDAIDSFSFISSAKFNLKVPKNNLETASGYAQLSHLNIASNTNAIAIDAPVSLFLTNGKLNFSSFSLKGTGGQLTFSSVPNSTVPIDIRVAGVFSLSLLHIFAPFLETIEGQTTINLKLKYDRGHTEMVGSAYVDDGYIKLEEIQHAIENMKADILFNQDRIVLNAINAKFASGNLVGDGALSFKGPKNIPMNLNLHLDNINLNIPPQVNTQGNASLKLSGSWLPFTLSGEYQVFDGEVTKELGGGSETTLDSPYHIFLPQTLRQKAVSPIVLDLDIILKNPLKIKNSLIDGKLEGALHVAGFPQTPGLSGKISLTRNSLINFKDVQFRIRDSSVSFNGETPPNPDLYVSANTDYRGYYVDMQVYGNANKPKFKLTSQPNLSEQEIISLLTLGYTNDTNLQSQLQLQNPNQNNFANSSPQAPQSNIEVGTGLFSQNPLGKEFKDRFGFDVQFSSSFDTANSVATPKVSIGKKLSDKMTITGSALTGKDRRYDAKLRYELNRDLFGTASITTRTQDDAATQNLGNQRPEVIGVDLEYRKEFK